MPTRKTILYELDLLKLPAQCRGHADVHMYDCDGTMLDTGADFAWDGDAPEAIEIRTPVQRLGKQLRPISEHRLGDEYRYEDGMRGEVRVASVGPAGADYRIIINTTDPANVRELIGVEPEHYLLLELIDRDDD